MDSADDLKKISDKELAQKGFWWHNRNRNHDPGKEVALDRIGAETTRRWVERKSA